MLRAIAGVANGDVKVLQVAGIDAVVGAEQCDVPDDVDIIQIDHPEGQILLGGRVDDVAGTAEDGLVCAAVDDEIVVVPQVGLVVFLVVLVNNRVRLNKLVQRYIATLQTWKIRQLQIRVCTLMFCSRSQGHP